jgi:multicomponent Na+:H+ antiporter subunit D
MTGKRKCTDLGGLFQSMPVTAACGIVGAISISSFPLTSGFVSKSMISQAAGDGHLLAVWLLLAAASAGVFLHAGIKFPWFVFFQRDSGLRPPDPPLSMRLAMLLFALLCIALGIWYAPLYAMLPYPVAYEPYTGPHVVAQLQLLLFSGLAFFVMLKWLQRTLTISLDFDWFYRKLAPMFVSAAERVVSALVGGLGIAATSASDWLTDRVRHATGPGGVFARTWASRSMGLWMLAMLLALLLIGYGARG